MSWLPTVVTSQPVVEPIGIEDARAQVRVAPGDTDFDGDLTGFIAAARSHIEQYTGTKLVTQTVELRCSRWCDLAHLPVGPISAVASIKYLDVNGIEQTLDTSVYEVVLSGLRAEIRLAFNQSWPPSRFASDAIRIVATAGYGPSATDVPSPVRQAMLLIISQWFDTRQDFLIGGRFDALPNVSDALLANFRIYA